MLPPEHERHKYKGYSDPKPSNPPDGETNETGKWILTFHEGEETPWRWRWHRPDGSMYYNPQGCLVVIGVGISMLAGGIGGLVYLFV